MTEPRNPLEVVEEALAAIAGITVGSFGDGRPDAASYQTPAEFAAYAQEGARAVLALVRKMRADAVVGWAQWVDDEHWLFEVTDDPSIAQDPALLLPLPDSTEPGK
jgi:hypothetical protein